VERYEDPKYTSHTTPISRDRQWVDCLRCGFGGDCRLVYGYRCSVVWSGGIGDYKVTMLSRSTQALNRYSPCFAFRDPIFALSQSQRVGMGRGAIEF
jgi:hypothetical protein